MTPRRRIQLGNLAELVQQYRAGASVPELARRAGIGTTSMRRQLVKAGVIEPRRSVRWCNTRPRSLAERFWEKVDRRTETECWEWIGGRRGAGYGQFHVPGERQMRGAHRMSWELHHGPIPDGLWVLHRCDHPPCVNPDHLFLGTRTDNIVDMAKKSRHRRQKIGPQRAAEILREWHAGWWRTRTQIAEAEGVGLSTISAILLNKTYRYVDQPSA